MRSRRLVHALVAASGAVGCSPGGEAPTAHAPEALEAPRRVDGPRLVAEADHFVAADLAVGAGFHPLGAEALRVHLPEKASLGVRLENGQAPGFSLTVHDEGAAPSEAALAAGVLTYPGVHAGCDWIFEAKPWAVEDRHVFVSAAAVRPVTLRLEPSAAVASIELAEGVLRARDAHGSVRLATRPIVARDAQGRAVPLDLSLVREGGVLRLTMVARPGALTTYPLTVDPLWEATTNLTKPRDLAGGAVLPDGSVLVSGGTDLSGTVLATAERYDPASPGWTAVGAMGTARWRHQVVTSGGKTLVLGGSSSPALVSPPALSTTELYASATKAFSAGPALGAARATFTATPLASGKVLIVGGENGATSLASVELWDPATGTITPRASLAQARAEHGAVRLASGKVLVAGGRSGKLVLSTSEIYDPATDTWTASGSMAQPRMGFGMLALDDPANTVVALGGLVDVDTQVAVDTGERWSGKVWVAMPQKMNRARGRFAYGTMPYGRAVVAGGQDAETRRQVSDLLAVATEEWVGSGMLAMNRVDPLSVQLTAQSVLAIGGSQLPYLPPAGFFARSARDEVDVFTGLPPSSPCVPSTEGTHLKCSGACVDLFCCDRSCEASCESCVLGTCKTVPDGPPASPRTCPGAYSQCKGGACSKSCATDDECNPDFYCDGAACQPRKALGLACLPGKGGRDCASNVCADGVCCDQKCDGACEACNVKGREGGCAPVGEGPPPRNPDACAPYACGTVGCRATCTKNSHCAPAFRCSAGVCIPRGARECSPNGLGSIDTGGVTTACGAYRCGSDGACKTSCVGTFECAPDFVCDLTVRKCKPAAATVDDAGCAAHGREQTGSGAAALGAIALFGLARRVRRARRSP